MKKILTLLFVPLLCWSAGVAGSEEQALAKIKSAMPPAPEGWVVAGETRTDPVAVSATSGNGNHRYRYAIEYKRIAHIREGRKQLDEAYAESSRRHRDAVKPRIEELIRQQTEASLALRKATRRRNAAAERRLNEELEANGTRMRALHEEVERSIARDVQPYLLRDTEAAVSIAVNEESAELPQGENCFVKDAAFALCRQGGPSGTAAWKAGEMLILYGDWSSQGDNIFSAPAQSHQDGKAGTIKITITGEQPRAEQLLSRMDLKAILSLMQ
jgi:hypothetical protein